MGWFKRNLFFAIGGLLALGLLAAAGYYDYSSWSHNEAAFVRLNEIYDKMTQLAGQKPSPGTDKVNNITAANDQTKQLKAWIDQTKNYFQPVPRIPATGPLSNESFQHALTTTIKQLQDTAAAANVQLPPQFPFSFTTDVGRLTFAPGSLEPLSVQLGEVKAISEVVFSARVNALDGIQRVRVSDDDANGPTTDYLPDYLNEQPLTNTLAVLTPYRVTFRGFSPEVAQVLEAFASSPHGFIVKTVSVAPASAAAMAGTDTGATPPPAPLPGKGGLQTVLNEQLLSVTLEVEAVKLALKN
jgi:hypothetical protein